MSDLLFAYLDISCWKGVSFNAEHYYGKLVGSTRDEDYKRVELEHPLTQKEATYLNKKCETRFGRLYKKGVLDYRFEKAEQVRRYGIKLYKTHFPDAIVLFEGDSAYGDPQPIIDGPEPFKSQVNALAAERERIGGYEGDEKRATELFREFQRLIKQFSAEHQIKIDAPPKPVAVTP